MSCHVNYDLLSKDNNLTDRRYSVRHKNNQEAFFALLRAGLWPEAEKQILLDDPVDWGEIYRLASEQSVLGLVLAGIDYLPIEQRPPKVELLQWIGEIQMLEQQNKEMNQFIGEVGWQDEDGRNIHAAFKGAGYCSVL